MSEHALLSASSSHRWLHCPPSAALAAQYPDQDTKYTRAGTLAHSIAELKARKYFIEPMGARTYNARLKKLKADPDYDAGMEAATDAYLEHLQKLAMGFSAPPFVALETRVDYSHLAPGGFGTADCIMIGEGTMHVVDYKNGAGVPVSAEHNPQMQLYALGALRVYRVIYGDTIRKIGLHVVQPNAGGVKSWETTRADLEAWGEDTVRPAAALAAEGRGDFCPGEWCDSAFCPARATCTARARQMLELEPVMESAAAPVGADDKPLLTDEQVGVVLARALHLQQWVESLKGYAEKTLLSGGRIAGFKLVEGRGSREWTDLDAAFAALGSRGVEEALLWERKPISVAGLEKTLGKKEFADKAGDLVTKKPGKPALVPESDKRPAYNAAAVAFEAVGDG